MKRLIFRTSINPGARFQGERDKTAFRKDRKSKVSAACQRVVGLSPRFVVRIF